MIGAALFLASTIIAKLAFDHHRKKHKFLGESTAAWLSMAVGCICFMLLVYFGVEIRFPSGKTANPDLVWRNGPWGLGFLLLMALIQQLIVMRRRKKRRI